MSKKNEFQTKALAAVMTASMVTGMAPASVYAASGEQVAKDGTYTKTEHVKDGEGDGWTEYDVQVSLTVENGKFKDITVTPSESYNDESKTYLNWAVDANTPKRVGIRTKLLNQSATESTINSWDTVSGATYTSKAIKEAALAAIKSAPAADAEVKIDTTALESAIAKAEALQKDSYTEASWNAMQEKLTAAKDALTKKESQDAVTKAASELETAISGLEAAPVTPTEKVEYVLMNIPYADFYASELNNSVAVDSVSSATLNKTRTSSLVGGSYHVSQGGEDITGIVFPVKVPEGMDLSKFKQVTDSDSVTISVTNRGQTNETTYTGKDALFENASYSYYVLSEAPSYYKEATVDASGNVSFGKVQGTVNKVSGVTGDFKTTSKYGDYQLNLDGITFDTSKISAVVFSTKEGHDYGMRHLENVWRGNEIAWCTGFTTSVHGCPTSSEHYAQMMGETIDKVTYYTTNGIYEMDLDDIYVPVKTSATLSVDNAFVKSGETKVNFENLPSDFDAEYSVEGLDAKVENGVLKFNNAAKGKYTLVVKDKKGKYADMSADFMLQTEDMPATYDAEKTALVTADGFKAEDLQEYVKSITSVAVNGKSYAASGRGATVIVNEDGSIKTDAAPFANGAGDYQIVVSATGYKDLEFTYTVAAEKVEYILMNIPYADFYAAELNNSVAVDSVSSATLNKTRTSSLVGGSYHVSQGGEDITGIVFPVKVPEGMDLSKFKQVTDSDSVTISVTNRGQTNETTYTGKDALFENASYSYYVLSEAPSYYKEATVDENGNVSFGKVQGTVNKVSGVTGEFKTTSKYGDYQLNLDGITFDTDEISAVVFSTKEGHDYGMRHLENVWKGHKIAWCTGFTTSVHGCPTSSEHYAQMMGETIDKVTYYTTNGIYEMDLDDIYVPVKTSATLSVDNAFVKSGETKVNFENLPSDFDAEYSVEGLDAKVENGVLKFNNAAKGKYTLVVKDKKGKYADMSADFMLQTEDMPAAYNAEKAALVTAEGFKAEDLQEYVKSITSVSVNGTSYTASGRGATVIINEDGSIKTDAAPFANGAGDYQIAVSATGYKDLEFTYTVAASKEEYKYVYAGLSWAEYWASEGVYLAEGSNLASSSDVADKKGELDKGAFDTVSRATTNHGLHRGSYQCTAVIYDTDGKEYPVSYWNSSSEAVLTDGSVITFSKGTITYTENGAEKTATMKDYEVKGIKYVPVKVKAADYDEFCKKYQVVENAGTLAGGFTEKNLQAYTETAEVTEKTNGLKEATKNEDGSFSFGARATGSDSGLKGNALKVAEGIEPEVKAANGSYGEFLRVDLNGNYGGLGSGMYATRWTYYGNDSTYTTALASYGTKFAADNWMHKSMGIQLGLTDSLRCQLPAGTDGTGYWELTVYSMGYEDYTYKFQATEENIVKPETGEISTTELEAAIAKAEALNESDYTSESWASMQTELQEAKEELAAKHSQATVDEATSHLNAAIEALVKAETPAEVNTTELEKVIASAKALKEADYTSETWSALKTALETAESALEKKESQEAVDNATKDLQAAIDGLKKAETPAEVNTTELEKVIASAKALKEADYTSETWSALKTALETAESALEKKESQEAVDNATKDLQTAIDGLKKVDNSNKGDDNKDNNNKNNNNKNNNTTNTNTTNKGTTTGTSTTNKGTTGTTATTNKGTTSTGTTGSKSTGTTSTSSNAKTGDPTSIWGWISLAVTSMGVGGFSWKARKKSRKDEEEK